MYIPVYTRYSKHTGIDISICPVYANIPGIYWNMPGIWQCYFPCYVIWPGNFPCPVIWQDISIPRGLMMKC